MLNPNAQKWVDALRSGKHTQTRGKLTRIVDGQIEGSCCLGVGCEVAIENGVSVDRRLEGGFVFYDGRAGVLPGSVTRWLGLVSGGGYYRSAEGKDRDLTRDNDFYLKSFAEIADIIESEPEGLFV